MQLRSGDFDGDGADELVAGGAYRVLQYTGSSWSSTTVSSSPNYSKAGLDVHDIDLDGDLDVVGPVSSGYKWFGNGESDHGYNPYGGGYGGGYGP